MAAALFFGFFLSAAISRIAEQTQMHVWWNYVDEKAYFKAVEREGSDYVADIPRPSSYEMTQSDHFVSELCDFLQTYTVLILSMALSCGAVFLFYRNKLKRPVEELELASKKLPQIIWISVSLMKIRMRWAYFARSLNRCERPLPEIIRYYGERLKKKRCCGRLSHMTYALLCPS